jgi:hypothetical protein
MWLASGPRLTEQRLDVLPDGAFAHSQLACDVAARSASRDKAEHFCLFLREDRKRYARVALHMRSTPSLAPKADQVSCHDSCPQQRLFRRIIVSEVAVYFAVWSKLCAGCLKLRGKR